MPCSGCSALHGMSLKRICFLNGEEIVRTFYEKELQKRKNQKEFRIEKVIKKGNKLHVKWKGYNNSFNSWMDKKISQYFPKPCKPVWRRH